MKIGYPCINRSVGCTPNHTFRLKSYSEPRLIDTVERNICCLKKILEYNVRADLLFFRIGSGLVPFASHPAGTFDWWRHFAEKFAEIGRYIRDNCIRISMHPDQFVVLNSPDPEVVKRSVMELKYHADLLDALWCDGTAKIQLHIGGVYGDRRSSLDRFSERYAELDDRIIRRLVIENDDRSYSLSDCMEAHESCGMPVLLDVFHHSLNPSGEDLGSAYREFTSTWRREDGIPMVDYSSPQPGGRKGAHAANIDPDHFRRFLGETRGYDVDIMLEIKDKEKSALRARALCGEMGLIE